jgi:hypothetical protein
MDEVTGKAVAAGGGVVKERRQRGGATSGTSGALTANSGRSCRLASVCRAEGGRRPPAGPALSGVTSSHGRPSGVSPREVSIQGKAADGQQTAVVRVGKAARRRWTFVMASRTAYPR